MNGLFITFTPVIAFFFLSEIKEMEKESQANSEKIKKIVDQEGEEEALNEFNHMVNYEHAFFHNFRSGLIKYVGTYITLALGSLLLLFFTYALLSSPFFLITDIMVLVILLVGVFPIVSVAFNKPVLTLITFNFVDRKQEIITYDD